MDGLLVGSQRRDCFDMAISSDAATRNYICYLTTLIASCGDSHDAKKRVVRGTNNTPEHTAKAIPLAGIEWLSQPIVISWARYICYLCAFTVVQQYGVYIWLALELCQKFVGSLVSGVSLACSHKS